MFAAITFIGVMYVAGATICYSMPWMKWFLADVALVLVFYGWSLSLVFSCLLFTYCYTLHSLVLVPLLPGLFLQ